MAGLLASLIGGGIAAPVEAVGKALDGLFTSDEEKAHAEFVLEKLRQEPQRLQIELNKVEATRTLFIAGWRPCVGWVCAASLAYSYVLRDLISWLLRYTMPEVEPLPSLDMSELMALLIALLGIGGYRTYEKIQGVSK